MYQRCITKSNKLGVFHVFLDYLIDNEAIDIDGNIINQELFD